MEEVADRPKWLLELENRKRKPRLAHEAGAGSPCMICNSACPGLDLHFWRKICKNCKCSRDDHDVQDDDFPQFDLLFGPSKKYKKKPTLLRVNEKQHEAEAAFEWVPPDTTKELASDYMKALPADKMPIQGTAGAALRRQLLQKQLPLHDIDYKACDELTDQEKKQFEKYLENLKQYVGQGKVIKMLSARPFDRSLMTPINATDMQRFSPQHKPSAPSTFVQLRTPSSFSPKKNPLGKNVAHKLEGLMELEGKITPISELYTPVNRPNNYGSVQSEPVKSGVFNEALPLAEQKVIQRPNSDVNTITSSAIVHPKADVFTPLNQSGKASQNYKETVKNPVSTLAESTAIHNDDALLAETILAEALRPPSNIHASEIIGSTLDEKGLMYIREKLANKYNTQENKIVHGTPSKSRDLNTHDSKNPPGMPNTSDYNPNRFISNNAEYVVKPEVLPIGVQSQIAQSVPMSGALLSNIINQESELHGDNEKLTDAQGQSCNFLGKAQEASHHLPYSQHKASNTANTIPANVACSRTGENQCAATFSSASIPTNVIYSENQNNQVFPHEPIGASQIAENVANVEQLKGAMGELSLEPSKRQKCQKCEEEIRVGDVVVVTDKAKNAAWHPGCFVCSVCNELLADLVHFHYKNKLYCGRDLASLLGIPRCFACDELIFVREYTVAEGHNYHVKHFCCWDCDVPLAGQQYITENDRPLCLPCYQSSYAKTCNACNTVIAADQQGVSVKNLDFHATEKCFSCYACKKGLLNSRMAIKEGKLFCSKECISSFLRSSA